MAHGDITHIDIPADDLERARRFYQTVIGWTIDEVPGYDGYPMWRAPNQISGGGLTTREEGLTHPRSYIEVDSIDDILARVEENGGRIVLTKTPISDTSWYAAFEDSEGNQMGLYEGVTTTD